MMTGQLVQHKGSLARAALPYVCHLRWGWHRVERALERGCLSLDDLFEIAWQWCLGHLEAQPLLLGEQARAVCAVDTTTIARRRAGAKLGLAGKGYCHLSRHAVTAHIVAALTQVVRVNGVRVGLVRRARFGASCAQAVDVLLQELPAPQRKCLYVVDAGITSVKRFGAMREPGAMLGRLRINAKLRCAPAPRPERPGPGRPPQHGAVLHPGIIKLKGVDVDAPEVAPDEELTVPGQDGMVRLRRWKELHDEEDPAVVLDVVRVDDPTFKRPLLLASTARELSTREFWYGYQQRWPVETDYYVAGETAAMEKPRAWNEKAVERRICLALLVGGALKAIAAACPPLAMGPWDRRPQPTAGRLANYLHLHAWDFAALALKSAPPRNYRKNNQPIEDAVPKPLPQPQWFMESAS